jgi:translation initiation factor eIF-2B subunit beta
MRARIRPRNPLLTSACFSRFSRELTGSNTVALHTADLLRQLISRKKFSTVSELLEIIRSVGKTLIAAHPIELAIGNIVRRVLYIIRHETAAIVKEVQSGVDNNNSQQANVDLSLSLHKILDSQQLDLNLDLPTISSKLKPQVIEEIGILMDEMRNAEIQIAEQAIEHIYAKEVILTFGFSHTVCAFLKEASKFRKFEIIVAESAPSYSGHKMALALQEQGIDTTVIADAAVYAMMPAVNKVIVGTHGVMANGGLVAHTGAGNIAAAAKVHAVPFVVVTGLHKLTPLYAFDSETFNEHGAPSQLIKFDELNFEGVDGQGCDTSALVDIQNPGFDYVEPKLVSLFITNIGGHNPSYIYRLLAEYYDPQDYSL